MMGDLPIPRGVDLLRVADQAVAGAHGNGREADCPVRREHRGSSPDPGVGQGAMSGSITLADVAARTDTLVVACTQCDRAGRYSLHTLIKRYNRRLGVPELLAKLSADCPKRQSVSAYDLCGIHCPGLSTLFLNR
jgi:hypothetical protein